MSAAMTMFQAYQWQNRLLLVFAPDDDHEDLRRQHSMLVAARHVLDERQTVVITVTRESVSALGPAPANPPATDIRRAYGIGPQDFEVLLIGKDGGVKVRQGEPLPVADLTTRIDAMPMRWREMQQKL